MDDIAIMRLADAMARHAAGRHELVARNIANADTPGYRAMDLPPFEAEFRAADRMKATRDTHLAGGDGRVTFSMIESAGADVDSPNGNNVALPEQIARGAQAKGAYDRALAVYGKTMGILKASLGRR